MPVICWPHLARSISIIAGNAPSPTQQHRAQSPTKISAGAGGAPTNGGGVCGNSGLIAPVPRAVAACSPDTGSNQRGRRSFLLRSACLSLLPPHPILRPFFLFFQSYAF